MAVSYVAIARTSDVPPGTMVAGEMNGHPVLAVNIDGAYHVFMRACPHEDADLADGVLSGGRIRCPGHSYLFDIATGECLAPEDGPALWTMPTEVRGDDVCVRLE